MSTALEKFIHEEYTSRRTPDFRVGDIVRVHQIVTETKTEKRMSKTAKAIQKTKGGSAGPTQRVQVFEGIVIARKHGHEPGASFTVRKIASDNVGVEKIFPLYSPLVTKIEVVSRPNRLRRSKLYFLRDRIGKKARRLRAGSAIEQQVMGVTPKMEEKQEEGEDEEGVGVQDASNDQEAQNDTAEEKMSDTDVVEEQKEEIAEEVEEEKKEEKDSSNA